MKFRWIMAPAQPAVAKAIARELQIAPLLAQCLLNRGFSALPEIARFLAPRLKDLADPFLIPGMDVAVQRLFQARENGESIVIFGDYDVDGVTATALLKEVMSSLGWNVQSYLPNRLEEGYGLTRSGIDNCLKKFPARLLLAVDCGSTSGPLVDALQADGVDVIVLDHHQVSNPPPKALALINPHQGTPVEGKPADGLNVQPGCGDFRELCSVGLAFKLAHALLKRGREAGMAAAQSFDLRSCLDLVALGTIADVVPLLGENRILVNSGLVRLNETRRAGLLALKEVAGITQRIGPHEVGFLLAPRLNAAGRLETALDALHLLLATDKGEALPLAQRLDAQNRERQEIERQIVAEVMKVVREKFQPGRDCVIVEGQAGWHIGVVGIVASRVLQEFYRPTIILGGDGEEWRGSGRSIDGFDLAAGLRSCGDLLVRHGGHAMAAGLALKPAQVDAFRERLNEMVRCQLQPEQLQPRLRIDAEISPGELTFPMMTELARLQHTGMGNPPVQLCMRNVCHQKPLRRMGNGNQHAKLWVTDGRATHEAVFWSVGDKPLPEGRFDVAFTPQLSEYNRVVSIQLKILDWRPAG